MQMKRMLAVALCAGLLCVATAHRSLLDDGNDAPEDGSVESSDLQGTRNPCYRKKDKCVG